MANWSWPVPGHSTITSGVGPRWNSQHEGIDISAPNGTSVVASRGGRVIDVYNSCAHNFLGKTKGNGWSGDSCGGGYGNRIYIDHQDGYITRYAHLSKVSVQIGQQVSKGQTIGEVGTTGHSTGYHLHFEIRDRSGNVLDPEKYVDPKNTTTAPASESSSITPASESSSITPGITSAGTANLSGEAVPYTEASTTAIRSEDFLHNDPMYAFLEIFIGDKRLSYENGKPSVIQSFEINRLDEAGCTAQFTLFDDNWYEIETYLAANYNNVFIRYGYSTGVVSPIYAMMLQDYSLDFNYTGVILSIKAMSTSAYDNINKLVSLDTGTKNPTEAIKKICNYLGWNVLDSNFSPTKDVDREENYKLDNIAPITYILNVIVQEAQTDDGEIVAFYVDSDGKNTAHLQVKSYGDTDSVLSNSKIKTYVYQKGYDSVVKDLTFDIHGVFGGTSNLYIATGLSGSVIDNYTKSENSSKQDQSSVTTSSTGVHSHTKSDQSIPVFPTTAETKGQMENKIYYHVKNGTTSQYEANMTIIGDPTISLLEDIRIINMTDAGDLHHTSGIYLVLGISDSIENGEFYTALKLKRNGDISEGIELRNPKKVVK